jgi:hypothetical protein
MVVVAGTEAAMAAMATVVEAVALAAGVAVLVFPGEAALAVLVLAPVVGAVLVALRRR